MLFDYWIFHNRSSKIIGQEVSIDENDQMKGKHRFYPIECLSLYCLKLLSLKNCKRQCHAILCTVSNTVTGPDTKLKLTAIGILNPLYTFGFFLLV